MTGCKDIGVRRTLVGGKDSISFMERKVHEDTQHFVNFIIRGYYHYCPNK